MAGLSNASRAFLRGKGLHKYMAHHRYAVHVHGRRTFCVREHVTKRIVPFHGLWEWRHMCRYFALLKIVWSERYTKITRAPTGQVPGHSVVLPSACALCTGTRRQQPRDTGSTATQAPVHDRRRFGEGACRMPGTSTGSRDCRPCDGPASAFNEPVSANSGSSGKRRAARGTKVVAATCVGAVFAALACC
jgi:hypothetical protein